MRPSGRIYSKEEFEVSKAILMSFLELEALKQKEYVLGVLKYEHKFLSTELMDVFKLELYSNSAHEGTKKGSKKKKPEADFHRTHHWGHQQTI